MKSSVNIVEKKEENRKSFLPFGGTFFREKEKCLNRVIQAFG
jgi:hypothetical protein